MCITSYLNAKLKNLLLNCIYLSPFVTPMFELNMIGSQCTTKYYAPPPTHGGFTLSWNTQNILTNFWQFFSCLSDAKIATISQKFKSHNYYNKTKKCKTKYCLMGQIGYPILLVAKISSRNSNFLDVLVSLNQISIKNRVNCKTDLFWYFMTP